MENRSLVKALSLIDALGSSPRPLTAAQLSTTLKITRPTVYRILCCPPRHGVRAGPHPAEGYAIDDVEFEEGVRCIAASPSRPSASMRPSLACHHRAHEVGPIVRDAVASVSRAMGWGSGANRHPAIVIPVHAGKSVGRSVGFGQPPVLGKRPDKAPHQAKEVIGRR